jgi:hypothetical protein
MSSTLNIDFSKNHSGNGTPTVYIGGIPFRVISKPKYYLFKRRNVFFRINRFMYEPNQSWTIFFGKNGQLIITIGVSDTDIKTPKFLSAKLDAILGTYNT